jgi:16S rRNA (uracil1498-N3)-methyltransferase
MSRAKDNSSNRILERLFFAYPVNIAADEIILSDAEAYHASKVMRLKKNDRTKVFDGNGTLYTVEVAEVVSSKYIKTKIIDSEQVSCANDFFIGLVQALPQRHKFDFILEKATELGVQAIIPLYSERTVYAIGEKEKAKVHKRWQTISIQAAKQSRQYTLPQIYEPLIFADVLKIMKDYDCVLLLAPGEGTAISTIVQDIKDRDLKRVLVMVGPEGGFSRSELEQAVHGGARIVTLGAYILKTDTAVIAAVSILRSFL